MLNQFSRTQLLLGKEGIERLSESRVAVFGIGGVGGYVCEALVRSGVGKFDLIDDDRVCQNCPSLSHCSNSSKLEKLVTKHIWSEYIELAADIPLNTESCTSIGKKQLNVYLQMPKKNMVCDTLISEACPKLTNGSGLNLLP